MQAGLKEPEIMSTGSIQASRNFELDTLLGNSARRKIGLCTWVECSESIYKGKDCRMAYFVGEPVNILLEFADVPNECQGGHGINQRESHPIVVIAVMTLPLAAKITCTLLGYLWLEQDCKVENVDLHFSHRSKKLPFLPDSANQHCIEMEVNLTWSAGQPARPSVL